MARTQHELIAGLRSPRVLEFITDPGIERVAGELAADAADTIESQAAELATLRAYTQKLEGYLDRALSAIRNNIPDDEAASQAEDILTEAERVRVNEGATNFSWEDVARQRAEEISTLQARVKELEGVVERLPKTADGKPITPGMELWEPVDYLDEGVRLIEHVCITVFPDCVDPSDCYSTREAAERAKGVSQ